MPDLEIAKLRRNSALKSLADGREAVPITLQFQGDLPKLSRTERKKWLRERAEHLYGNDKGRGFCLRLETVSPSAQTVEALCPVEYLRDIQQKARLNNDRVDVQRIQQVLD
jgi:hypothetical protein